MKSASYSYTRLSSSIETIFGDTKTLPGVFPGFTMCSRILCSVMGECLYSWRRAARMPRSSLLRGVNCVTREGGPIRRPFWIRTTGAGLDFEWWTCESLTCVGGKLILLHPFVWALEGRRDIHHLAMFQVSTRGCASEQSQYTFHYAKTPHRGKKNDQLEDITNKALRDH